MEIFLIVLCSWKIFISLASPSRPQPTKNTSSLNPGGWYTLRKLYHLMYLRNSCGFRADYVYHRPVFTRVGALIVATIYLQLIQNRYMFRSFTVLKCSHQHCVQPVASDVEVVEYL